MKQKKANQQVRLSNQSCSSSSAATCHFRIKFETKNTDFKGIYYNLKFKKTFKVILLVVTQ
ncbi:hypothetical protein BM527_13800 [Alteromonas sp. Mex14]|nr:hypothetical protein BM527_13800 [Alteromonas sp. Mex14]